MTATTTDTDDSTGTKTIDDASDIDWETVRDRVQETREQAGADLMTPAERATVEDVLYDLHPDERPGTLIDYGETAGILVTHDVDGEFEDRYSFNTSRFGWEPPTQPRVDEFRKFVSALEDASPDDYEPYLFRCERHGKAPAVEYGSWKAEENRISVEEAIEWMETGGNVGLAGTDEDGLVNVDIDDDDATDIDDLKPTLMCRSRSRDGFHAFYWEDEESEEIPNIPTDEKGEVRTEWQYVVAAGSYVPKDPEEVPEDERDDAGYYTVERLNDGTLATITLDELPEVFRETMRQTEELVEQQAGVKTADDLDIDVDDESDASALYEVPLSRVISEGTGNRWTHPFHGSDTESNACITGDLLHCWRHEVSHNALQALAHLAGEEESDLRKHYSASCERSGTAHKASGAGPSDVTGNDEAILAAWVYAKRRGYIPEDDPVPRAAMSAVATHYDIRPGADRETEYTDDEYLDILEVIEDEYEVAHGRDAADDVWEYDDATSPYYEYPAVMVSTEVDDLPEGYETNESGTHWTCDGLDAYAPGLALIAVVHDYLEPEDLSMGFVSEMPAVQAAHMCAVASQHYGYAGRPPYHAVRGVAEMTGIPVADDGSVEMYETALDAFDGLAESIELE